MEFTFFFFLTKIVANKVYHSADILEKYEFFLGGQMFNGFF